MSYAMVKVTWVPWVTMGYGHHGHPIIIMNGIPELKGIQHEITPMKMGW